MKMSDVYKYLIESYIGLEQEKVVVLSGLIKKNSTSRYEDYEHIEELALEIRNNSSYPMLDICSESLKLRTLKEVPEEKYFVPKDYYSNWVSLFDYIIDVSFPKFENLKADMVFGETTKRYVEDSVQHIFRHLMISEKKMLLPNFPKESIATYYDLDLSSLTKFYLGTYEPIVYKMKAFAQRVLNRCSTDEYIKFQFEDNADSFMELKVDQDSIINELDTFSNTLTYLPFGYVKLSVKMNSITCNFIADKIYYKNRYWNNVAVSFSGGNLTFIKFEKPEIEHEFIKTSLLNKRDVIELHIGTNNGVEDYCNYNYYDRCIENNFSLVFYDEEFNIIQISTKKIKF